MENKKEKREFKPLKELTLLDSFLFNAAMEKPEIAHNILSIILGNKEIPSITVGIPEKNQKPFYDSRAVRLDLLAFDKDEVVYDAEAQKKNTGNRNLRRRSRYYQSQIDVSLMKPGDLNFGKLNDVYVIFISPFDLFGKKKYMYTFRMTCDEADGMPLDDGAVRIYLNTHGENDDEVSPELIEFLHYMEKTSQYDKEIENERVRELANQIEDLKSSQEVGVKYMQRWEEIEWAKLEAIAEGRAEGEISKTIESIQKIMKNMNLSIDQVMDVLEISEEERPLYREKIENGD